ncbi:TIGR03016 family PEP-CTERM system-associated outer membrane protein [Nitrosomonas sp. Nm58]|uniref:TIGR03016 family PEP-CTERM system-associated outer membrane protein n=1 Tax=Nitrosomonas sp. Nm58 TaxID=200126 RepID=UPI00089B2C9F|nr:uncharacterized protein, PEP-CTERM system associated [Nitrosomonas sp. Nm58]
MMLFSSNSYFCRIFYWIIYLIIASLLVSHAVAADWEVKPRLNLRETYTDNLRLGLGGGGGGGGDFITQINPGILLTGEGRRFNTNINYMMNNLIYAEHGEFSRIRHQLNANATAELIEDRFFVDGFARMTQQNAFLFGPQSVDNANPVNRRNVNSYSVSPYFKHRFKDFASAELRYVHGEVNTSGQGSFSSSSDSGIARLASGADFRVLKWGLNYNHTEIRRDQLRTIDLERSIALLRYVVTPQFDLIATGGYERNSFISVRGKSSGPTWTVGFAWAPTERTEINLSGGQRFFGDTYLATVNHRTRLTTWNLSYNQDITTFGQQSLFGSAITTASALDQLLSSTQNSEALLNQGVPFTFSDPNNFLTNRLFLQRRLQAFLAIKGNKNTLLLRGFNLQRRAYTAALEDVSLIGLGNALLTRDTDQTGGNISWNHRLTPQTSANINYSFTRIDFLVSDRIDDNQLIMFSLNKRITPNMNGMISYFHNWRNSNQSNSDFNSNNVTASLNMNF